MVAHTVVMSGLLAYSDANDPRVKQRKKLKEKMAKSKSYYEWSINAAKLDEINGFNEVERRELESKLYDRQLLDGKVGHLRHVRQQARGSSGLREQMYTIRSDLVRNLGNIASSTLHEHFPIVPRPIREYIDEVRVQLEQITYSDEIPLREKSAFLRETRHAFGRTALILSGGGALGAFHLGVLKALLEHRMLPRVLAGSKSGAIVCAIAATRTDSDLYNLFENLESIDLSFFTTATSIQTALHVLAGAPQRTDLMRKRLRHLLGDLTFSEAYTITGRAFSIPISFGVGQESSRVLNYLTAPHVLIWSAVACSSGFAGLNPKTLLVKGAEGRIHSIGRDNTDVIMQEIDNKITSGLENSWRGGHIDDDMPMRKLSETFGVNHFIVSQTTPHVAPALSMKRNLGIFGELLESEFKHRCRQFAELIPRWAPNGWLKRLSQPWEGDVTIVLPNILFHLHKTIVPATQQDLQQVVRQGELCTWAKMSAVQCNCGIEVTLDACLRQVAIWERQDALSKRRSNEMGSTKSISDLHRLGLSFSSESLNNKDKEETIFLPDEEYLPLPEEMITSPRRNGQDTVPPYPIYDCVDNSCVTRLTPRSQEEEKRAMEGTENMRSSLDFIAP